MKRIVFAAALKIVLVIMSGCDSNTIEQCPNREELDDRIVRARESVQSHKKGYVIVGRVVLDGDGDVRDVTAQMEILDEGFFAGPTKDLVRPVGFRMHQYAPYDLQLAGMKKDENIDVVDVGTIHMKPLSKDKLADLKAKIELEGNGDPAQATIQLSVRNGPVNTPSNGTEGRPYWPEPVRIEVLGDGLAQASGFSPIDYWCIVKAPGYLDKSFSIKFKEGQTLDLRTITLEKPRQIELDYVVSKEPPFDTNDLETVKIPAGTRWKAVDDIYGWDLEFKQNKGSILMNYSYAPCYIWDLGTGEIEEYADGGESELSGLGQRLLRADPATNEHVYLVHQESWGRWILFKIFIEDRLATEN